MIEKRDLPCFPCPYSGACCTYGTDLVRDEAEKIAAKYGADKVIMSPEDNPRTAVVDGACVFLKRPEGTCMIHGASEYPAVCRGFPWINDTGDGPYGNGIEICPELDEPTALGPIRQRRGHRRVKARS